jgi:methyl-accepting chemotaxis protein WspA
MIDGKPVMVPGSNMESSSYYEGPRQLALEGSSQRYVITEPYVYEGKMMVEHASPIIINGRFAGIGGCDRLLGSITMFLQSYKPYKSADFLLVSRLGGIIVGTNDSSLRTRKYDEIEQKDILAELMRPENAGKVMRFTDPKEHRDFYFACAHIPTGNWTLFMRVAHDELAAPIYNTLITIGIISLGLMVLLVVVLIWLVNSIVRPITMAASTARRVAAGDLTVNVPAGPADETGMLLESIRNMTDNLNGLVLQVQRTGVRVVSSATEIFASTRNLQSVAADQYEFANQVLTATREISATAGALKVTMESVRDISEHAKESAQSSREYLDRMERASGQMLRASRTISQKLGVISDKAGNVSKITTTINKISDQINILSINAAIEAEKAGEYGKGFSIVAREIRRLSDQTTEGTDDIEALINSMQTAVSLGVAEMDKFMRDVSSGVNELAGVNERIELIVTQVQDLAPRFGDVADSMTQQIQGVDHINESVVRLTQGAKQIEDSLTEFINVTSELKQEAEALKNQISNFKLRN